MEPNQTQIPKKSGFKAIYGVIIAILAVGGGFLFWNKQNKVLNVVDNTTSTTGISDSTNQIVVDNRKYKDGTYTAPGTYTTPEGRENISVTLVIKDGIVKEAVFTASSNEKASEKYQGLFNDGFKTEVIGKSLDSISLTVVNGSSLTPKGFMDALDKIKLQARA